MESFNNMSNLIYFQMVRNIPAHLPSKKHGLSVGESKKESKLVEN